MKTARWSPRISRWCEHWAAGLWGRWTRSSPASWTRGPCRKTTAIRRRVTRNKHDGKKKLRLNGHSCHATAIENGRRWRYFDYLQPPDEQVGTAENYVRVKSPQQRCLVVEIRRQISPVLVEYIPENKTRVVDALSKTFSFFFFHGLSLILIARWYSNRRDPDTWIFRKPICSGELSVSSRLCRFEISTTGPNTAPPVDNNNDDDIIINDKRLNRSVWICFISFAVGATWYHSNRFTQIVGPWTC